MAQNMQEALTTINDAIHNVQDEKRPNPADSIEVILDEDHGPDTADILGIKESNRDVQKDQEDEDKEQRLRHPRRRQTSHQRIAEMTYKNKVLESQLMQERQRIEALERDNRHIADIASQKEEVAIAQYEHALRVKAEAAKHILEEAIEDGDTSKQAEAQQLMTQFGAELALLKKQKETAPHQSYQREYQEPAYAQQMYAPPVEEPTNPHFDEWLDRNHWFGQDPHLTEEVNNYATELTKVFRYNNLDHLIGTPDFFKAVDDGMAAKYRVNASNQEPQRQQSYAGRMAPVAPINRQGGYAGNSHGGDRPNQVRLSKEQCEIADSLPLTHPDGTPKSAPEKRRAYAYELANPRARNGLRGI
jgi:hypothetical protein